ncbi:MAG: helix-turn-helix domain-containing protein [Actinomycetota bacterium]
MKSRIVDVSLRLFARRGIDGVSIAEVALAAGVSKANVMHHFGSKNGLYAACLDVIDGHLHAAVDRAVTDDDAVDGLAASLASWSAEYPDDCRVMAYGLLRLLDQPGRWALASPVERMVVLVAGAGHDRDEATRIVVDLLGTVTYREMAQPLISAGESRIDSSRHARQEHQ